MHLILTLALNLLLVLLLLQLGSYVVLLSNRGSKDWLWGMVFGFVVILNMMRSVPVAPGWFLDFRNVIMLLGGFVGGTVTYVIAAICGSFYRLYLGGAGAMTGVAALFTYGLLGATLQRRCSFEEIKGASRLVVLGVMLASVTLFFIIGGSYSLGQRVPLRVSVVIAIYVLTSTGTLLSFKMFFAVRDRLLELATMDAAARVLPTALVVKGSQGEVLVNTEPGAPMCDIAATEGHYERTIHDRHYLVGFSQFDRDTGEKMTLATYDDITVLKGALRQLENFFALAADGMLIIAGDNRIAEANEAFSRLVDLSAEETVGAWLVDFIHPEDVSLTICCIDETRQVASRHQTLENRLVRKDGTVRWLSWSLVGAPEEQHVYAVVRDITEDRCYEQELRAQADVLKEQSEFLALAHDAVVVRDIRGKITYWNKGAQRTYGYAEAEAVGLPYHGLMSGSYPMPLEEVESDLLLCGSWSGEVLRRRKDGSPIILWSQWVVKTDSQGLPESILEVSRDITARRQAEMAQAHLAALVQQSGDAIVSTDLHGNILTWNSAATRLLSYTAQEMDRREFAELIPASDRPLWQEQVQRVSTGIIPRQVEVRLVDKFGGFVPVSVNISSIISKSGHPEAISLIIRDLTAKLALDKEMARIDRLSLASQLAAGIGHEVRNPLTTVRGYLQFFCMKPDLTAFSEQFKLIIDEIDRINDILTEFLTLARNRPVELKPTELNVLIESALPLLQSDAELVGCDVCFYPGDVPTINLSEKEVRQLLINLVRNGLEASVPGGIITIRTELRASRVVLSVSDQGQGIPEDIRSEIGTPFFTTKQQGTGMGLAVCYAIAEQHQAEITFETSPHGTTFYVSFDS